MTGLGAEQLGGGRDPADRRAVPELGHERTPKRKGGKVFVSVTHRGDVALHEGYLTSKEARRPAKGESLDKPVRPEISAATQNYIVNHEKLTDSMEFWSTAEDRLNRELAITNTLRTPVNFIVHTLGEVNDSQAGMCQRTDRRYAERFPEWQARSGASASRTLMLITSSTGTAPRCGNICFSREASHELRWCLWRQPLLMASCKREQLSRRLEQEV